MCYDAATAIFTSTRRLIFVIASPGTKLRVPVTAHRRPVVLEYYEACRSEVNARRREKQLKTGFGRAYLKRRLAS